MKIATIQTQNPVKNCKKINTTPVINKVVNIICNTLFYRLGNPPIKVPTTDPSPNADITAPACMMLNPNSDFR
ncbi:MAG: hypothetical protein R2769_02865 [Saprospiraceae bacterium]